MALPLRHSGRMTESAVEEWMVSLTSQGGIGTVSPEQPSSVVSAIRFLLKLSAELDQHGNHLESIKCGESALLLRHANEATVEPLLTPIVAEGLLPRGKSVEQAEDLVLRCNSHAVRAFNEKRFEEAEVFLGRAIFLTDVRTSEEGNYFIGAEPRRIRLRAATLNNLGCMEKRRRRLEESLLYLRQAVELEVSVDKTSRGSPSTYLNLCTVLNELGRHHDAVNSAENAIAALEEQMLRQRKEQLPSCAMMLVVGLYNMGVSLEHRGRAGDADKAHAAYQRALEASRKYFVDPNCPTVELAMEAIRRMHTAPVFRADQVEATAAITTRTTTTTTIRVKPVISVQSHASTLSLPEEEQRQQQHQQTHVEIPLATSLSKPPGSNVSLDRGPILQPTSPPQQERQQQQQQERQQQEEERHQRQQQQQERQQQQQQERHQQQQQQRLDEEQEQSQRQPNVLLSRVIPVTEVPSVRMDSKVENVLLTEKRLSSERSAIPTSFASFPQATTGGGLPRASISGSGELAPLRASSLPKQAQTVPGTTALRPVISGSSSLMSHTDVPVATRLSGLLPPPVPLKGFGDNVNKPISRPTALVQIVQGTETTSTHGNLGAEGSRRVSLGSLSVQKGSKKAGRGSSSSTSFEKALNPFGRRMFGSSLLQGQQKPPATTSQRSLPTPETVAVEKHVQRSLLRQSMKSEEAKKKESLAGRRGSALARAKEREQKRIAKEEARNDAEMADALYNKFVNGMRAEELSKCHRAATRIQRIWRGCLARTLLLRMVTAARRIQRVFRVHLVKILAARRAEKERLAKLQAEQEKREMEAVIVLQGRVRQFLRRLQILRNYVAGKMRRYYAARKIQREFRAFLKRKEERLAALMEAQRLEDEWKRQLAMNAARCIQWAFKRYLRRKEETRASEIQRQREKAAATIQGLVRGVLARAWFRYYKSYCREQELRSAASQKRLILIQAYARVLWAVRLRREKEVDLMHRVRQNKLRRAATKIQCQWRCRVARIKLERLRAEHEMRQRRATKIQRWYATCVLRRRFLEIREHNRQENAAKKIQQWYFDCKARRKEREMVRYHAQTARRQRLALLQAQSILLLQAWGRCYISTVLVRSVRSSFLRLTLYAEAFQRIGRGYAGRRLACRIRCHIIYESRMRVELDRKTVAACVIQRAWRCALAKDTVEQMRRRQAASICIAKHYRGYLCRQELLRLREAKRLEKETHAVVIMQRAVRQFLKRLELIRLDNYHRKRLQRKLVLMRREEAVITLQAAWRGRATRMALKRERKSLDAIAVYVVKIQRAWRARKFRRSITALVEQRFSERMCQSRAALVIQCFWRKMMAAEEAARLRERSKIREKNAILIQCWWRRILAMWTLESLRNEKKEEMELQLYYMDKWDSMVTLVNTALRVRAAQQELLVRKRKQLLNLLTDKERERFLNRHNAAIKIQALYRGHYERMYARGIRRQKKEEERRRRKREALEKRSAIIIQCAYRSWRAICEANARRAAKREKALEEELQHYTTVDPHEVVRQLFWVYEFTTKRDLVKRRLERSNECLKAAQTIQHAVRQWLSKKRLEKLRRENAETHAARIIQSYWKEYRAREIRKEMGRQCEAAVKIQARYRGYIVRRDWKKWQAEMAAEHQHQVIEEDAYDCAATVIQSCWRRISAQRLAEKLRAKRDTVKEQQLLSEAAKTIQSAYRHYRQRCAIRRFAAM